MEGFNEVFGAHSLSLGFPGKFCQEKLQSESTSPFLVVGMLPPHPWIHLLKLQQLCWDSQGQRAPMPGEQPAGGVPSEIPGMLGMPLLPRANKKQEELVAGQQQNTCSAAAPGLLQPPGAAPHLRVFVRKAQVSLRASTKVLEEIPRDILKYFPRFTEVFLNPEGKSQPGFPAMTEITPTLPLATGRFGVYRLHQEVFTSELLI